MQVLVWHRHRNKHQTTMNAQAKDRALAERILWDLRGDVHFANIKEAERIARVLRRAQLTLHRWAELECGVDDDGRTVAVERDEQTGRPFMRVMGHTRGGVWFDTSTPTNDREAGALARVEALCKETRLHYYHQTDPRGCALYVSGQPMTHENYHRGIACL